MELANKLNLNKSYLFAFVACLAQIQWQQCTSVDDVDLNASHNPYGTL